jgi:hypothetical protein
VKDRRKHSTTPTVSGEKTLFWCTNSITIATTGVEHTHHTNPQRKKVSSCWLEYASHKTHGLENESVSNSFGRSVFGNVPYEGWR